MGRDSFGSQVETLRTEGKAFTDIGKDFRSAVKLLVNGLTALEGGSPPSDASMGEQFWSGLTTLDSKAGSPPWGDDEIGEKYGVVYEGLRNGMYESMGHLAAKLQEIGGGLAAMARNHETNEGFTESMLNQHIQNEEAYSKTVVSMKSPQV
ncbi:hypothetical protein OG607_09685 [Streptomyces sp. NBC_01537]|uniref:hypothetical protein n=1 Tax=Streptomyces sp. NBC_01537 TaxID=2903896 RepID=UPI00386A2306